MNLQMRHFSDSKIIFILLMSLYVQIVLVHAAEPAGDTNQPVPKVTEPYFSATNGMGSWIWASETRDGQTCQFWNTFNVPASSPVVNARLVMTADDEFTLFLDGREMGRGVDWRELFIFDLTPLLTPGRHVLGVQAFNSAYAAGVILGLQARLADGQIIELKSDSSWRIVPAMASRWQKRTKPAAEWPAAVIKGSMGTDPWSPWPVNAVVMPTLQPFRLAFWQTAWFQAALLTIFCLTVLISLRLMAQLAFHRKERWLLQQERTRIAREIHDDIGSRMTQLVLHGEVAQRELREGSEMQRQLAEICEESRGVLATMDEILWAVNPQRDTLRDFAPYVCKYAEEFLKATPIQCLFEVDPEMPTVEFNLALRRSLLMAFKEALNNAVKHSEATELRVQIHWRDQHLNVAVQDNGKGFDPAWAGLDRHGMANLKARLKEMGGSCQIVSRPGTGCRVEFSIPLKQPRASLWDAIVNAIPFTSNKPTGPLSSKP